MLEFWVGLGAGLALLFAAGHGLSRHSMAARACLVVLFCSIGVVQLCWWRVLTGDIDSYPWLMDLHYPALFLIGPCVHVFSQVLRADNGVPWQRWVWHFLPAGVATLYGVGEAIAGHAPAQPDAWPVALSAALGASYVGQVAWQLRGIENPALYLKVEMLVLTLLTLIGAGVALSAMWGGLLANAWFYRCYLSLITAVMVASYLLGIKYPELIHYLAEAPRPKRYERTQLAQVDVDAQKQRLQQLMEEEQLYQDETLTLASLAERMQLSTHQLSELLNERMHTSFSRLVKERRVQAAAQRLLAEPDEPVLDIGLAVGFNSSSAFYSAFREVMGVAPGQYRKRKEPSVG